jgi:hypothetical protein
VYKDSLSIILVLKEKKKASPIAGRSLPVYVRTKPQFVASCGARVYLIGARIARFVQVLKSVLGAAKASKMKLGSAITCLASAIFFEF